MDNENVNKSENKNILKEYDYLKMEINQKIELHNNLLTFTITAVVAILSFTVGSKNSINPFLFLIPFCILIPMSIRIAYYRFAMAKLAAYIIVFLEDKINGMKWETRNRRIGEKIKKDPNIKDIKLISTHYYECFIIGILCYVLYAYNYYILNMNKISLIVVFNFLWPILPLIFEGYVTIKIDSITNNKEYWVKKWKELKSDESNLEIN